MKQVIRAGLLVMLGVVGLAHAAIAMNMVVSNGNHSAQILVFDHSHTVSIQATGPEHM